MLKLWDIKLVIKFNFKYKVYINDYNDITKAET